MSHYVHKGRFVLPAVLAVLLCMAVPAPTCAAGRDPDLSTAFVAIAKQNIPAVVHIDITERREVANPLLPFENDPFFRYFFGTPKMPKKFRQEVRGLGTGMIMDPRGFILTNYHVAGGATKIEVLLTDGRRLPAKLVGGDPKTDLAVIRVEVSDRLPFVTFGDSDAMEVGEWVATIGVPRGLDHTVTQGIISAKHRTGVLDPTSYQDFLQTDAAINPGNSGGPLLNLRGEVIGITSAIVSTSGGFEGIGFAIPSNMAVHISRILMEKGKVERGWVGVSIMDVTYDEAKKLGMSGVKGAQVAEVLEHSPAAKAGLRKGDVILSYDGHEVRDAAAMRNTVSFTPVGRRVELTVLRDGKERRLELTIGKMEEATQVFLGDAETKLGASFRPVTAKEGEPYGIGANQAALVTSVKPLGPLAEAGIEVDDIVVGINGQPLSNVRDFAELVSSLPAGQQISLLVVDHRSGNEGMVRVKVR
jgi:serine protease Do